MEKLNPLSTWDLPSETNYLTLCHTFLRSNSRAAGCVQSAKRTIARLSLSMLCYTRMVIVS